jgi:type IV pilus assembly protein PilX
MTFLPPQSAVSRAFPANRPRHHQSGAVLVVALLFLLIITMLGVTSMQSTTSEERMAGNVRDWNNSLQAAEAALRDAWFDINGQCAPGATSCSLRQPAISGASNFGDGSATAGTCSTTGLCMPTGTYPKYVMLDTTNWSASGANAVYPVSFGTYTMAAADTKFPSVSQQPQYVIEALCMPDSSSSLGGAGCPTYHYRITARGYGGNSNTQVTLQMIVRPL